jgi:chromate reductase, NAD(P)H dehydrogenase (quinone)
MVTATPKFDLAVLVGSLRKESWSRKIALAFAAQATESLTAEIVEIGQLPLYNQDLETELPPAWATFRQRIKAADAVLFVTPEYNRGVPGVLKNAIDVGSRPGGQSSYLGKPAAVISVTPGALGAFGANHHLRQSLVFLDMPTLQQPEMYLANAGALLDPAGQFVQPATRELFTKFTLAFTNWISLTRRRA